MLKTTIALGLVAAPFLVLAQQQQPAPGGPIIIGPPPTTTAPCPNPLDQEPVLVHDITGYTLTGVLHRHLCVYDNGAVSISSVSGGTPLFPAANAADLAFVPTARVRDLYKDLRQVGAFRACDEPLLVADLPLTTVTVFGPPAADSKAHTFSYFLPQSPETQAVEGIVQAFVDEVFPNF